MIRTLIAVALASAAIPPALAQADGGVGEPAATASRGVGAEFMVFDTGIVGAAHDHFVRGLALLHSFEYDRAAAAFRTSQESAPDWVMAYWGEAMTHNHPLWAQQDRDKALEILSRLGADPAARAAKARSDKERAWLAALETLYAPEGTKIERDLAYRRAMEAMLAAHPEDIDVRAFTGLATLGTSHGGRQIPIYMEAAGVLEPGFMTHPMHPGILHYLIHSYDDPVHAPLGERMAARYAVVAPDAGHAQHMVSHIFLALADWEATERANVNASRVVNEQRAAQGRPDTSCGHYNEWLSYALLQQGKDASGLVKDCVAQTSAAAATAKAEGKDRVDGAWSAAGMAVFLGIETGEWLDPIDLPETPATAAARYLQAHGDILRYHGSDPAKAAEALERMEVIFEGFSQREDNEGRSAEDSWSARQLDRSKALVEIAQGSRAPGLAGLEQAAAAELAMPIVFGPPAIFKPSYEILGEIHLAQGRKQAAREAFEKSLELAPGRRLSLAGLEAATAP